MASAALESYRRSGELLALLIRENPKNLTPRLQLADVLTSTATLQVALGKSQAALSSLGESLTMLEETRLSAPANVDVDRRIARANNRMGEIYSNQLSQHPKALAALRKARQLIEPLAHAHPEDTQCQEQLALTYRNLAMAYQDTGASDAALEMYRKGVAGAERVVKVQPTVGRVWLRYMLALRDLGRFQAGIGQQADGLATTQKALDVAKALAADNPTNKLFQSALHGSWNGLAAAQYGMGHVADALASMEAAGAVLEQVLASDPGDVEVARDLAGNYFNCGLLNRKLDRHEAALKAYQSSLRLRERLLRAHPKEPRFTLDVGMALHDIGQTFRSQHRLKEAKTYLQRSVDTHETLFVADPANPEYRGAMARGLGELGATLADLGELDQAVTLLNRGLRLSEQTAREQPRVLLHQHNLAAAYTYLASVLRKAGRAKEAEVMDEKAFQVCEKVLKFSPADANNRDQFSEFLRHSGQRKQKQGQAAEAARDYKKAAELLEGVPAPSPEHLYNLACCYALLRAATETSGSGVSSAESLAAADKAIAALRRAVKAGFADVENLRKDTDLGALRHRGDFEKLIAEVEKRTGRSSQ
jgi:tetratricopeptide (TPR) repeat protein